jgi:hypothetical protein
VKIQTLRTIFALSAQQGLIVHQVDINTAFLNGDMEEEIFIEPGIIQGVSKKSYYFEH